jgi:hypothetical protein
VTVTLKGNTLGQFTEIPQNSCSLSNDEIMTKLNPWGALGCCSFLICVIYRELKAEAVNELGRQNQGHTLRFIQYFS